jgi:hypothetical protein
MNYQRIVTIKQGSRETTSKSGPGNAILEMDLNRFFHFEPIPSAKLRPTPHVTIEN